VKLIYFNVLYLIFLLPGRLRLRYARNISYIVMSMRGSRGGRIGSFGGETWDWIGALDRK
jgi:hypothetical protein